MKNTDDFIKLLDSLDPKTQNQIACDISWATYYLQRVSSLIGKTDNDSIADQVNIVVRRISKINAAIKYRDSELVNRINQSLNDRSNRGSGR
jgi:hypothetical protein